MFDKMNINPLAMRTLKRLARSPGREYYLREIAADTGGSVGGTHRALAELRALGLVKARRSGRNYYHAAEERNPALRHVKIFASLLDIQPLVEELRPLSKKLVLFGSCSTGEDTEDSDVDMLIVTGDEEGARQAVKRYEGPRPVRPLIFTPQKLLKARERDPAFHSEIDKGIILYRTEDERL
jgi:predicted nucleotidyltransferase